jgi:hypothetical protein
VTMVKGMIIQIIENLITQTERFCRAFNLGA